jgi:hypothetical protein
MTLLIPEIGRQFWTCAGGSQNSVSQIFLRKMSYVFTRNRNTKTDKMDINLPLRAGMKKSWRWRLVFLVLSRGKSFMSPIWWQFWKICVPRHTAQRMSRWVSDHPIALTEGNWYVTLSFRCSCENTDKVAEEWYSWSLHVTGSSEVFLTGLYLSCRRHRVKTHFS